MKYQHILIGTIFAAAITALFYLTGIDWSVAFSTNHMDSALMTYFIALAVALLPFGALLFLLRSTRQSKIFQTISFSAFFLLPIISFGYWRINHIRTAGWDFLIVPFWQLILVVVLLAISSVIGVFSDQQPDT
jgi:peptidoglycan/LPS O-acetylase OafA/YrhL